MQKSISLDVVMLCIYSMVFAATTVIVGMSVTWCFIYDMSNSSPVDANGTAFLIMIMAIPNISIQAYLLLNKLMNLSWKLQTHENKK